jgi:hypothetical protein
MGLDMYLTAEKFLFSLDPEESAVNVQVVKASGIGDLVTSEFSSLIRLPLIYWRKSNAIHKWFVDNVQDGDDDYGIYYVSWDHVEELQEAITEVLQGTPPEEVLPTAPGFFFGSQDYDDWYYKDLKETEEKLIKLLKRKEELKAKGWVLRYTSSW